MSLPSVDRQLPLARLIAASSAAVMAFHGVLHEVIGPILFPWLPPLLGPLLWHGMGASVVVLGLLAWCGIVGLLRFLVVPACTAVALLAVGVIAFIMFTRAQFHWLALSLAILAAVTAVFHRRAAASV